MADAAYFASLARKQIGAGVVFTDAEGRILLVRRAYADGSWTVPGGAVDAGETPLAAAHREVLEETGLDVQIGRLLGVDWIPERPPKPEALLFLFDGGRLTAEQASRIVLPAVELAEHSFVSVDEAVGLVTDRMLSRLKAALPAKRTGATLYFEEGRVVR
jgi:8-oxo-dGTP diphosphatase